MGLVCTVLAFVFGMNLPVILGKDMWIYIAFAYIFLACCASDVVYDAAP